ncbi:hypothetical protein [Kitasatospora griseola]|uniref:hypothetical protein n=1 Tax=Kitasatospora griseola TaxID=2064 RepID=UPI003654403C
MTDGTELDEPKPQVHRGPLPPWQAPEPGRLAELRSDLVEYTGSAIALQTLSEAINAGRFTLLPTVPSLGGAYSPGAIGSQLLTRLEVQRLRNAGLYYATADMTALALAAAQVPPKEAVQEHRLPSPAGFMVFQEPIGGYAVTIGEAMKGTGFTMPDPDLALTTPIVAVSWSDWTPDAVGLGGEPGTVLWAHQGMEGDLAPVDRATEGVWMTFWAESGSPYDALPADQVVSVAPDGTPAVAGLLAAQERCAGPLSWDNEVLLRYGAPFSEDVPGDDPYRWAQVVYTAWQLMAQQGSAQLAEIEEVPRRRAGAKRDRRAGIGDDGTVRIVRVHTRHRPTRAAVEKDAQASTGRREPSWSCRWPVAPHRRDQCMRSALHEAGECWHEDRIIPPYIKGPADKPLRVRETVNLWDRQPE